jgi:uncharacterized membrane protein YcaP (DUF421 family)
MEEIEKLLGLAAEPKDLTLLQISLRGLIVFVAALMMIRVGDKRFMPKKTAFDAILVFILASMLARAINGSAAFFPTLGGGFVLVLFHRLMAKLAFRWHAFGKLVKGTDEILIRDGELNKGNMKKNDITERDLEEELRLNGNTDSVKEVKEARMERSGEISVVHSKG